MSDANEINVVVRYGPNDYPLNFDEGVTVRDVFNEIRKLFNIPEDASPQIKGEDCDWTNTVEDGTLITFHKTSGKKG